MISDRARSHPQCVSSLFSRNLTSVPFPMVSVAPAAIVMSPVTVIGFIDAFHAVEP